MAPLEDFGFVDAEPVAAAQQLAIIAALYQDRRDLIETLLGTDGAVLHYHHEDDSWPTSFCVLRSGPGRYFVVSSGTVNVAHWSLNVWGTVVTAPTWLQGDGAHMGFLRVYQWYIRPAMDAALSGQTIDHLYFAGHSLGGAVAHIGARDWCQVLPPTSVSVCTFGQPKTFIGGATGTFPNKVFRWRSWQDAVPYLPPERKYAAAASLFAPVAWASLVSKWQHLGPDIWLAPDGTFPIGGITPEPLPADVRTGPLAEHQTGNYLGRLRAWYDANGTPPVMGVALAITAAALAGPDAQPVIPELPHTVIGFAGEAVPFPFYYGVPDPDTDRRLPMAQPYPTPITSGRNMKLNVFFNTKDAGWSETWLLNHNNTGDPYEACEQWMERYMLERKKMLSQFASADFSRVSDIAISQDSETEAKPARNLGPGLVTAIANSPNDGWQCTLTDITRTVRAQHPFRGFANVDLVPVQENGVFNATVPVRVNAFRLFLNGFLTVSTPFGANGSVTPVVRTLAKDPALISEEIISEWGVDGAGRLTVTVVGEFAEPNQGDVVSLSHKRIQCVHGFNGRHTVASRVIGIGNTVFTFTTIPRCPWQALAGVGGVMRIRPYIYIPIKFVHFNRATYRQAGRPFAGSHGHR